MLAEVGSKVKSPQVLMAEFTRARNPTARRNVQGINWRVRGQVKRPVEALVFGQLPSGD